MVSKKLLILCSLILIGITACASSTHVRLTPTPTSTPKSVSTATLVQTPTPTSTSTQTNTPQPSKTPSITYIVQEADTLWGISQRFGVPVDRIAIANSIWNYDQIYPGQVIIIPNPSEVSTVIPETNKRIVVILSQQKTYAYEGDKLIREFLVSTGVQNHPTVLGTYYIYIKLESTRMTGEGYDLPNVPWTMYFYQGYSFHGTYWHHNFGHPMSHGCVNMYTPDADWLYHWAPLGTKVEIYP